MTERVSEASFAQIKSKIKVVFLGDQSTGKTSILLRFMHNKFEEGLQPTVGIDFMAKNITIKSMILRLQLWDTAGQERFRSLIPSYLKDAAVSFIVFDITNKQSFDNIKEWIELCQQNRREKSIMILLGNKSDLSESRQVSQQKAIRRAKEEGMQYFQLSAKLNTKIQEAFHFAGEKYIQQNFSHQMSIENLDKIQTNQAPIKEATVLQVKLKQKDKNEKKCC